MKDNNKDVKDVNIGNSFDDMDISEMAEVQGAGDVDGETVMVSAIAAGVSLSIQITKTFKGKC